MSTGAKPDLVTLNRAIDPGRHVVQFYWNDDSLLDELGNAVGERLAGGSAAIILATRTHCEQLDARLRAQDLDVEAALADGSYKKFIAEEALSEFMVGGLPDAEKFTQLMESALEDARHAAVPDAEIFVFGEMVAVLIAQKNNAGALRLEQLWNELAEKCAFSLRCAYPANEFSSQEQQESFLRICAEHSAVVPSRHISNGLRKTLKLTESKAFDDLLTSLAGSAICMLDAQGDITSWSKKAEGIHGFTQSEMVGKDFSCLYPLEQILEGKPRQALRAATAGHFEGDTWLLRKNASRFWAHVVFIPFGEEEGRTQGYCMVIRDNSQRKIPERGLHRSHEQFRMLVDVVQDYAIFMLDAEGNVSTWNAGAQRIKGYTAGEIIGSHFSTFYPEEDLRAKKPERELKIAAEKGSVEDEGWRVRKDGSRFWANVIITAIRDDAGRLVGFTKVTRDVTERMQVAQSLRESEMRYRTVTEMSADAIITLDSDARIQFVNPATTKIFGYSYPELIGRSLSLLIPPSSPGDQSVFPGQWRATELVGQRKDRKKLLLEVNLAESMQDGRRLFICFIRDISARKRAEQKITDSEKAFRTLSVNLLRLQDEERRRIGRELHDSLGQQLVAMKMSLDSLASTLKAKGADVQEMSEILGAADEAIREVRTISYLMYPPMLDELGLRSAIAWYLDGFAQRSGIRMTFEAASGFTRLPLDVELAMFRVLQESLTNVHRHSGSQTAHVRLFIQDGNACLQVSDRGKGVPANVLRDREGMRLLGVGLRGMDERIRQLGGTLEIFSTTAGTTLSAMVPMPSGSEKNQG